MHTRYFERQDSKASQFWAITLNDRCFEIHQGKVGTPGKFQRKDCGDRSTCEKKAAQQVQAQAAKGFSERDLTQPNDLGDFSAPSLQSILSLPSLPPAFFEGAANTSIYEVQKAIANHPQATRLTLETLAQSSYPDVVELVQLHVNLAGEMTEGWQEAAIARLKALDLNPKRKSVLELAALGIIPDFLLDSLALDLRVAIAKQPETAPQTLALLAEDYHENVRKAIAANPNTPTDVLEILVGDRTVDVRVTLAKNPITSASALIQLADDVYEKVRKTLIQHPNLPGEALYKLRNLVRHNVEHTLAKAAQDPQLSPSTLALMAKESHWWIRQSVAGNPSTPLEILEALATDCSPYVRKSLANNPNTSLEILIKIFSYQHSQADLASRNPKPPISIQVGGQNFKIEEPIFTEDDDALEAVSRNQKVPFQIIEQLIQKLDKIIQWNDGINIAVGIVSNPNIPISTLEWLASEAYVRSHQEDYFQRVAHCYSAGKLSPTTPEEIAQHEQSKQYWMASTELRHSTDKGAYSDIKKLYWAMAQNPATPATLRLQLLDQLMMPVEGEMRLDQRIVYQMVRTPDIPVSILEKLGQSKDGYSHEHVAKNPNTPSDVLLNLASSQSRDVLQALAQNPNTPSAALERLANLPIGRSYINGSRPRSPVHEYVARHPNTPTYLLHQFAQNTDELIRAAVASNPNVPADLLAQLAQDRTITGVYMRGEEMLYAGEGCDNAVANLAKPFLLICRAVINNPSVPTHLLEQFAKDENKQLRELATARLSKVTPALDQALTLDIRPRTLLGLVKSGDAFSCLAVFFSLQTPEETLTLAKDSIAWWERYAIAQNSNTPQEIVQQLTLDHNCLVRTAALEHQSTLG